jgi:hypothetical protein
MPGRVKAGCHWPVIASPATCDRARVLAAAGALAACISRTPG